MAIAFTVAIGLTVMVNVIGVPVQPFPVEGVTVIVAVVALVKLLTVTNDGIFPVPLAANPMAVLLFTQVYVTPDTALPKTIGAVVVLPHNV